MKGFYKNLIEPLSSKFEIDKDMMIEIKKHNPYQTDIDARKKLIKSFIRSIDKFKKIDDRKWDV